MATKRKKGEGAAEAAPPPISLEDLVYSRRMREGVERGEGYWIVEALYAAVVFAHYQLPLPAWLVPHLAEKLNRYTGFEVRTLDEAFGVSRKGMNLAAARRTLENIDEATFALAQLAGAGLPVNEELFEAVGEKYGVGRSTMVDWWTQSDYRADLGKFEMAFAELPPDLQQVYRLIKP
jgi:hypothetical protein